MAGEIERFVSSSSVFEVKPAKSIRYDDLISSKHVFAMEGRRSIDINEDALINLLLSEDKQLKALNYLDQLVQKNNGDFAFHNKRSLFKAFGKILNESSPKVSLLCTKLLVKLIPLLGVDVDAYVVKMLPLIICNVGNPSIPLQKESIQMLYVYMKHSLDVDQIFRNIAKHGIQHENPRIRQQIVHSFPTLLFTDFKGEDFFDIVNSLAVNLTESHIDHDVVLQVLNKMKDFLGKDAFNVYINRLSSPLRHNYYKCCVTSNGKVLTHDSNGNSAYPKQNEAKRENSSSKYPLSVIENSSSDNRPNGNFSKSGHFDTVPSRRRHPLNVYSSLGAMAPYDAATPTNNSNLTRSEQTRFELSFIPSYIIEQMSSPEYNVRLQAVEGLRTVLLSLKEPALIKENMVPLLSLLQPVFDDKNYRVACGALRAYSVMISKIGSEINSCVKLFVFAISRKLGNVKDSVRSECYKILLQIMGLVGRQKVLNLFWDKLTHKQYKVREDFLCIVIATLLMSLKSKNWNDLDFDSICNHVAARLTDNQQSVRQAALDCIAVLGHILGTTNKKITSAVDKVELRNDNASGIMSAVHARLLKKQLPRLNENYLVEYAAFPAPAVSLNSPMSADLQWIYAAEKPKKASPSKIMYATQGKDGRHSEDFSKSKKNNLAESGMFSSTKRHLSASKNRKFPWISQEDVSTSKLPSSAPVANVHKQPPRQPPFQPRITWGPESEVSTPLSLNKSGQVFDSTASNGPSYQELYKRRKEAEANKNYSSSNYSSGQASRTDSGYQPSFATRDFSASSSSSSSKVQNQQLQDPLSLSNSCPSSFFDKNPTNHSRRLKKAKAQNDKVLLTSASGNENLVDLIQKPTLARSAPKHREPISSSKDFLKPEEPLEHVHPKLKNESASPRFDRMVAGNLASDQTRSALKSNHGLASGKLPGPLSARDNDEVGYTPSSLQKTSKNATRNEMNTRSSYVFSKELRSSSIEQLDNPIAEQTRSSSEVSKSRPAARPVVPSHFSPARHRGHEDTTEFQVTALNSIRRSAQNKREKMKSQPNSEDAFSNSFTDFSTASRSSKNLISASQLSQYDALPSTRSSSQPVTSNELVSSVVVTTPDTPPFKYSPNTGVTFETKKADPTVSVVGIRYPSQTFSTSTGAELKSPSSSTLPITSNSGVNLNKPMPTHERLKAQRGSSLGVTSVTNSPDLPPSRTFNVQGKGVFGSPSTTSLTGNDLSGPSPAPSPKEDSSYKPTADLRSKEQDKIFGGVTGVAVKQPSVTNFEYQSRSPNDVQVSLSASLKERKERQKEILSKTQQTPPKISQNLDSSALSRIKTVDNFDLYPDVMSKTKLNDSKVNNAKAATLPMRGSYSGRHAMLDTSGGNATFKPGPGPPMNALSPLDHPEKGLNDSITSLSTASSENWELITQAMYTLRRLVTHHPQVLAPRFHDVIVVLNKYVPCLRSQVSKASAQTITDLYSNLKKPVLDTDVEVTIRTLLIEHGKQMSFIKDETEKTLQAIIDVASTNKTLNALLNTGLRHKNKNVRNTAAKFCSRLVDKIGPGKALSGIKDTTERILEAMALFVTDSSPDVRYYGRHILNELMVHEDFNKLVDRYLSNNLAQNVKSTAINIKQRGLGSLSSAGLRKGGSGRSRNGSSAVTFSSSTGGADRSTPITSSSTSTKKAAGGKIFNEQDKEILKKICDNFTKGSLSDRQSAIAILFEKIDRDKRFVEENVVKIMGSYVVMLTTAQTKVNFIALETLPRLIIDLHPHLRDTTPQLVPALLKLVSSKQHYKLALNSIDCLVKHIEPLWIIHHFANSAMYTNAKAKPIAVNVLTKLVDMVARKKPQLVERNVFLVLWHLLSNQNAPGGTQLRHETYSLASLLYTIYGMRLYEHAETKNVADKLKGLLGSYPS